MRKLLLPALFVAVTFPALAQQSTTGARPGNEIGTGQSLPTSDKASNTSPSNTRSTIAPRLPGTEVSGGGGPRDYLMAAQKALSAKKTGAAQEALERAESRVLARSVAVSEASMPSRQSLVQTISSARQALAAGNHAQAMQLIDAAMKDVQAGG